MSFLSLESLWSHGSEVNVINEDESNVRTFSIHRSTTENIHHGDDDSGLHALMIGFPPGSLAGIHRERRHNRVEDEGSFNGTIVSSAPSGDVAFVLQSREHQQYVPTITWAGAEETALSMTTTETVYRNFESLENSVTTCSTNEDAAALSVHSSTILSSLPSLHSSREHQVARFPNVNTAISLQRSSQPQHVGDWFAHFTEEDWAELRVAANVVLHALTGVHNTVLPVPPQVSLSFEAPSCGKSDDTQLVVACSALPDAFLCVLCGNVIVGATTLNCGCSVCTECWESDCREQDGYFYVETRKHCPNCQCDVEAAVPCRALDVAIFRTMTNSNVTTALQQHAYYARLEQWRREVIRRNEDNQRNDLLLAQLIQREEELLWNKTTTRTRQMPLMLFLGECALCVALASLSAMGITALSSRRG